MSRSKRTRAFLLASAVLATAPMYTHGQTSGSWVVNADGNWSDATKWNVAVPDGGGVATFNALLNQNVTRTITLDISPTLSGMVFNSGPRWVIPVTGTQILTLQGAGSAAGVLTSNLSAPNGPSAFSFGPTIIRPIAGANGIVKNGPGNLTFQGTNTYTGGTTITGGTLLSTTGDGALGTGGAANGLTMNGGIWAYATTAVTSARNVNMLSNGTFISLAAGSFSGVFSGSGSFNKLFSGAMNFQAANTITGALNFQSTGLAGEWDQGAAGVITFQGAGTALNTSAVNSGGTIVFDNAATNINGRLNSAAAITLHGGGLSVTGNATASTTESVAGVTADAGVAFFTVTPNAAQPASLTMASFTRGNNNVQIYRATGLGNAPGNGVGNIFLTAAPALTGGGGAAGSQNISIIKGAFGGATATNTGTDMVTYGATGVRPLALAEYRTALGAGAATDNVRLGAATAVTADETMNSLNIAVGAVTGPANTLTITSGMLLNAVSGTHTTNFNFGTAEGNLHNNNTATYAGAFSGSGGLTRSGTSTGTFTGASTYTGNTVLLAGTTQWNAVAVPANTAGPFGNSNDPIIIEPGGGVSTRLWFSGTGGSTFDRPVIARGLGTGSAGFGVTGSQTLTINGNITLERQLDLEGSTTGLFDINGVVSGTGRLTDRFNSLTRLNGNNTFSGGIAVNTGSYFAGSNTAYGTGRIYVVGLGTLGASGAARTVANPMTLMNGTLNIGSHAAVGAAQNMTFTGPVDMSGLASINFNVSSGITATFAGAMNDGAIVKVGAGTLRLTAANPYIGGTTVNAGTLDVSNSSGSGTGAGDVQVNSGATLAGTGSIQGSVTFANGGIWSPGNTPGTLTEGATVLNSTSSLVWELDTAGIVGSGVNDLAVVNGNLTLDGTLTVTPLANFGPGTYTLITYSGALTDNTLNPPVLPVPFTGTIDTTSQPGAVLLNVVPEPATMGVLGMAAAGLLGRRRRRA